MKSLINLARILLDLRRHRARPWLGSLISLTTPRPFGIVLDRRRGPQGAPLRSAGHGGAYWPLDASSRRQRCARQTDYARELHPDVKTARASASCGPGFVVPCQPTLVGKVPDGDGWLHEIKHDGFRVLAFKDGEQVRLWSRNGRNWSSEFTAITAAVRALPFKRIMFDGEAVAHCLEGLPHFHKLFGHDGRRRPASGACKSWLKVMNPAYERRTGAEPIQSPCYAGTK